MTDPAGRKTVLADASVCESSRTGGWGGAIIFPNGTYEVTSGPLEICTRANQGEAMALANTLEWALREAHILDGESILMCTDSHWLICKMGKMRLRRIINQGPRERILLLKQHYNLTTELIQIKGHPNRQQRKSSLRHKVMHTIDHLSRMHMLNTRASVLKLTGQSLHDIARQNC